MTRLVVGEGPLRSTVQHAAGANAHVLGRRDDVPCLLDAADVYVSTSHREVLSLSLLEAMAAGFTPIVTDLPENVEAVDEAGLAFAPGDEAGLADALRRLVSTDGEMRATRERGARAVATHFDAKAMVEATLAIYDETYGGRR